MKSENRIPWHLSKHVITIYKTNLSESGIQLASLSTYFQLELYFLKLSSCMSGATLSCRCYFYFGHVVRFKIVKKLTKFTLRKVVGMVLILGLVESQYMSFPLNYANQYLNSMLQFPIWRCFLTLVLYIL